MINFCKIRRPFFKPNSQWARLAGLFFMASVVKGQVPFECSGQFFVGVNGTGNSTLYTMNADLAGTGLNIYPPNLTVNSINAIGFRKTDHLIYGYESGKIFTIDKNGLYSEIANVQVSPGMDYFGGDVSPDGKYYMMVGGKIANGVYQDVELMKVDLENSQFTQSILPISGGTVRSFDIAFDPTNGLLYGLDVNKARIFILDSETGAVSTVFPADPSGQVAGGLFFDGYGNLFSYGTYDSPLKNTLYSIDKNTGAMHAIATGPGSGGGDGCSCPYTVSFAKTVFPESVYPCSEVLYTFAFHNLTDSTLSGLWLKDELPAGFQIVDLVPNTMVGQILSGIGSNFLWLQNLLLPPGVSHLSIKVQVGNLPGGIYKNQARLGGIPTLFGGSEKISDDPGTNGHLDSTALTVGELDFEKMTIYDTLCQGDTLWADVSDFGEKFLWQDGSSGAVFPIIQSGKYEVSVIAGCDTAQIYYLIQPSFIEILEKAPITIETGDTVTLFPIVMNPGERANFLWADPFENSLSCIDCANPTASPLENTDYLLTVTNEHGCIDSAIFSVILDKTRRVFAPNAFTPNGDGINDTFYLHGKGNAQVNSLKVFSRWGNLVFEGKNMALNDPALGWDGTFKGAKMPTGVFTWIAEVVFLDGEKEVLRGDVILVQ